MESCNAAISEFLLAGQARGWSEATHRQYAWHLDRFSLWLAERQLRLADLTRSQLRTWLAEIRGQWQPATCRIAVVVVRGLLAFCQEEGTLDTEHLMPALQVPRVPPKVQRTITLHEVELLLDACVEAPSGLTADQARATAVRNAAIVALLFDSLIRASELCRLDLCDLDLPASRILVQGKGGGQELVCFGEYTGTLLQRWLEERPAVANCSALFVSVTGTTPGQRLTTNGLRTILKKLGERAGVPGVSPHAFRRGGAVQALVNGAPSRVVQLHGRWRKIDMVEVYTRSMAGGNYIERYSPMGSLRVNGGLVVQR